ncbi:MAG: hypothetical protein AVDCRST_MAG11-2374, partial [uncultured Gemmatimonadaceae bacterium]
ADDTQLHAPGPGPGARDPRVRGRAPAPPARGVRHGRDPPRRRSGPDRARGGELRGGRRRAAPRRDRPAQEHDGRRREHVAPRRDARRRVPLGRHLHRAQRDRPALGADEQRQRQHGVPQHPPHPPRREPGDRRAQGVPRDEHHGHRRGVHDPRLRGADLGAGLLQRPAVQRRHRRHPRVRRPGDQRAGLPDRARLARHGAHDGGRDGRQREHGARAQLDPHAARPRAGQPRAVRPGRAGGGRRADELRVPHHVPAHVGRQPDLGAQHLGAALDGGERGGRQRPELRGRERLPRADVRGREHRVPQRRPARDHHDRLRRQHGGRVHAPLAQPREPRGDR